MTAADAVLGAVVAIGLVACSIGVLALISIDTLRMRIEGGLCIVVGIACIVAGNLDAIGIDPSAI
jgi:hypothetical protein